ncbi:MAG: RND transporter, partial [FCB group bacterium]|nr:RND transporter [FCB group bacterium]
TKSDTTLRPSMTTSNIIEIASLDSVLSIPLECIHSDDSLAVVFIKSGSSMIQQEIKKGRVNDNAAVIDRGVSPSDKILISAPEDRDNLEKKYLN